MSCTSYGSRPAGTFIWLLGNTNVTYYSTHPAPIYNISTDTYTVTSTLTYRVNKTFDGQNVTCVVKNVATYDLEDMIYTFKVLKVKCKYRP